jgi:Protein of unknown function (DUF4031)
MTVYVDQFPGHGWGRWTGGGHLLTSDLAQLHQMAARIGLRQAWFQDKTFPHYDLTATKRSLALAAGAVPIGYGQFPDDLLVRDQREGAHEPYAVRRARHTARPTQHQHRAMHALWRQAGITDRSARLALAGAAAGRTLASSNDLSEAEADALIAYMRRLNRTGLLATTATAFLARALREAS